MTNTYGFPYWLVRRADLQRALYHGAARAGAQVHFARAVFAVQDDEQVQPRFTLGDGEEFSADIIIGAEGARSRCLVAAEGVHRNLRTRHLLESVDSNAWLGPRRQLLGHPIRDGKDFNIGGIHLGRVEDPNKSTEMVEDIEAMRSEFGDFDPVVRELLTWSTQHNVGSSKTCQCWISGQALPDGAF
ncbi:kinesin-like nuclear fusion protein [Pestalotiopsis sp. IQ-011]